MAMRNAVVYLALLLVTRRMQVLQPLSSVSDAQKGVSVTLSPAKTKSTASTSDAANWHDGGRRIVSRKEGSSESWRQCASLAGRTLSEEEGLLQTVWTRQEGEAVDGFVLP